MVQGFAARPGGGDGDAQVFFYSGLADEVAEALGPEVGIQREILGLRLTGNNTADRTTPARYCALS
jgi:hypothetical protein